MHSLTMRYEVLGLLEGGLSERKAAKLLGVSRGFVNNVRHGRYMRPVTESKFVYPSGCYARCPVCGGLVQMPCLLCSLMKEV